MSNTKPKLAPIYMCWHLPFGSFLPCKWCSLSPKIYDDGGRGRRAVEDRIRDGLALLEDVL